MVLKRLDNGYRRFPDCRKYIAKLPGEYAKHLYYDTRSFFGPALKMAHELVGADRRQRRALLKIQAGTYST